MRKSLNATMHISSSSVVPSHLACAPLNGSPMPLTPVAGILACQASKFEQTQPSYLTGG